MTRTMLSLLSATALVACAPSPTPEDTFLGMDATTKGLPGGAAGGPLLPVTYAGGDEVAIIQVVRTMPSGADQVVAFAEVESGAEFALRLPISVQNPLGMDTPGATFRVVARQLLEDGRQGGYLDVSTESVTWNPPTETAPARWSVVSAGPDGVPRHDPLRHGIELGDRLRFLPNEKLMGAVDGDLAQTSFSIALLTDGDALLPAYSTPAMTADDEEFSVGVQGPPPIDSLRAADGPTSGHFWPVAFSDVNGVAGFQPETDKLLGVTCLQSGVVALIWSPAPRRLVDAVFLGDANLRAGWSVRVEGPNGAGNLAGGTVPWLGGDCI